MFRFPSTSVTPDVAAVIVAYRNGVQLAECLESALDLEGPRIRIVVVNNDRSDSHPRRLTNGRSGVSLIEPTRNIGFCAAVNLALRDAAERYVLILSPDGRTEPTYARRLAEHLEADSSVAVASGLIRRMSPDGEPTDMIDSCGIEFLPGRLPADIGHGRRVNASLRGVREVFGVTAAATLYRMSALAQTRVNGQILPEDFFMYLDDVDLAWRLRWAGYRAVVDYDASAWHARALAGDKPPRDERFVERKLRGAIAFARRPGYLRALWWSNRLLMLVRNDDPGLFLEQLQRVLTARLIYEVSEPMLRPDVALWARLRFIKLLPAALAQRLAILRMRRVPAQLLARWLR